ncbi:hypothetical protein ACLK11_04340 [Escherichia coli]
MGQLLWAIRWPARSKRQPGDSESAGDARNRLAGDPAAARARPRRYAEMVADVPGAIGVVETTGLVTMARRKLLVEQAS